MSHLSRVSVKLAMNIKQDERYFIKIMLKDILSNPKKFDII